jgi:hypothetical protein
VTRLIIRQAFVNHRHQRDGREPFAQATCRSEVQRQPEKIGAGAAALAKA